MHLTPTMFPGRPACFSPCGHYRYSLWRKLNSGSGILMVIGLNPSKATDLLDDNTIRRLIGFAEEWGYRELCMTNLFAYCATKPVEMKGQPDPVGPDNDGLLRELAKGADKILVAWGNHGTHRNRAAQVQAILGGHSLFHFYLTKQNEPTHPLYVKGDFKEEDLKT